MRLRISMERENLPRIADADAVRIELTATDGEGAPLRIGEWKVENRMVGHSFDAMLTEITLDLPEIERAE